MFRLVVSLLILCLLATVAHASKRVALVIGNSNYVHVDALANPHNDAEKIASSLRRLGFEVITGYDLTRRQFISKTREFSRRLRGAQLALFYYAGHGLQVSGKNYLAPVDGRLQSEADLDFEMVGLDFVLKQMEREAQTSLVFLDACRDNPLARNLAIRMGTRSANVGRGLASVETGIGTLIAFATQPGNVALDGKGSNSPFTKSLLKFIETPGEDISVVLRRVRQDVIQQTDGKQVPWENSSLTGSVVLKAKQESGRVDGAALSESRLQQQLEALQKRLTEAEKKLDASLGQQSSGQSSVTTVPHEPVSGSVPSKLGAKGAVGRAEAGDPATTVIPGETATPPKADPKLQSQVVGEPVELDLEKRRNVQMALAHLGHDPGVPDGQFGPRTRRAIRDARESLQLPPGDVVDLALLLKLPDPDALKQLQSKDARKYTLSDLPDNVDPRLKKAVSKLLRYEIRFGYFQGNLYIAVLSWGLNWNGAKLLAESAGGHLASITSRAENQFIYRLFSVDDRFIEIKPNGRFDGPWIGLVQDPSGREPAGGWGWVTGEKLTYQNWQTHMPGNYDGNAQVGHFWARSNGPSLAKWRDQDASFPRRGLVIEIE